MNWRLIVLGAVVTMVTVVAALLPPIPQNPAYHHFADAREWFGIPNFLDVVSNLPFLIIGVMGLRLRPRELWPYRVCFAGVLVTAFGSAWYHWNPNDATLVWDRLPMAIGFMGLLSAVIAERVSFRAGIILLGPLCVLGIGSVVYWQLTDDLRIYGLVQFGPALLIPALILLFPTSYAVGGYWFRIFGWYTVAKFLEHWDKQIFAAGSVVSGHTLKHLAAALACYEILRMASRSATEPPSSPYST